MIPVRDPGHHHPLEVGEDRLEALRLRWGVLRKAARDVAGLDLREYGEIFDVRKEIRDPVDRAMAVNAEGFRIHIAGL